MLALAAAVLLDRAERIQSLLVVIVGLTVVAAAIAAFGGLKDPGRRQESFLGEHNLATLSAFAIAFGLFALVTDGESSGGCRSWRGIFGAIGITLRRVVLGSARPLPRRRRGAARRALAHAGASACAAWRRCSSAPGSRPAR